MALEALLRTTPTSTLRSASLLKLAELAFQETQAADASGFRRPGRRRTALHPRTREVRHARLDHGRATGGAGDSTRSCPASAGQLTARRRPPRRRRCPGRSRPQGNWRDLLSAEDLLARATALMQVEVPLGALVTLDAVARPARSFEWSLLQARALTAAQRGNEALAELAVAGTATAGAAAGGGTDARTLSADQRAMSSSTAPTPLRTPARCAADGRRCRPSSAPSCARRRSPLSGAQPSSRPPSSSRRWPCASSMSSSKPPVRSTPPSRCCCARVGEGRAARCARGTVALGARLARIPGWQLERRDRLLERIARSLSGGLVCPQRPILVGAGFREARRSRSARWRSLPSSRAPTPPISTPGRRRFVFRAQRPLIARARRAARGVARGRADRTGALALRPRARQARHRRARSRCRRSDHAVAGLFPPPARFRRRRRPWRPPPQRPGGTREWYSRCAGVRSGRETTTSQMQNPTTTSNVSAARECTGLLAAAMYTGAMERVAATSTLRPVSRPDGRDPDREVRRQHRGRGVDPFRSLRHGTGVGGSSGARMSDDSSLDSSPEAYCCRHAERWSLPDDVFGSVPGATSTTSFGGMPTESRTARVTSRAGVRSSVRASATTTMPSSPWRPSMPNGDDVAGPHPDLAGHALDVLGVHVAPADDDHVLDAAAQHQLAVDEVAQVAGAEPAVVEARRWRRGAGSSRGDRRAPDLAARPPPARRSAVAGGRVDDAHLQAGHGGAQQRQPARRRSAGVDGAA